MFLMLEQKFSRLNVTGDHKRHLHFHCSLFLSPLPVSHLYTCFTPKKLAVIQNHLLRIILEYIVNQTLLQEPFLEQCKREKANCLNSACNLFFSHLDCLANSFQISSQIKLPHSFLLQRITGCRPRHLSIGIMTRNRQYYGKRMVEIPLLGLKKQQQEKIICVEVK